MTLTNSPGVQAATTGAQAATSGTAQMLVLKKALDSQAAGAATLLQTLPPPLASEGTLGTQVNTFA